MDHPEDLNWVDRLMHQTREQPWETMNFQVYNYRVET